MIYSYSVYVLGACACLWGYVCLSVSKKKPAYRAYLSLSELRARVVLVVVLSRRARRKHEQHENERCTICWLSPDDACTNNLCILHTHTSNSIPRVKNFSTTKPQRDKKSSQPLRLRIRRVYILQGNSGVGAYVWEYILKTYKALPIRAGLCTLFSFSFSKVTVADDDLFLSMLSERP
jgi:hypothetical protein